MTGPVIDTTATEAPDGPVDDGGFDYVPDQDRSTPPKDFAGNVTPDNIEPRYGEQAPAPTTTDLAVREPSAIGGQQLVPAADELRTMVQMANTFAHSNLVPKSLHGKTEDCLLVLWTARDLGIALTTAFRKLHPIDGQITVAPTLRLAIVRQRGLGRVWKDPASGPGHCTWYAIRSDDPTGFVESSSYGVADARSAGLVGRDCDPTEGTHGRGNMNKRGWASCGCKDNWVANPRRMPSHRALGFLMEDVFPEVGTGLYSADELGAVTDEHGNPVIDVTEVGPLDGMPDPEPTPAQRREQRQAQADAEGIDPDDAWHLQARIRSLPDEHRDTLRDRWKGQQRLGDRPPWAIPASAVALAKSLVAGVEGAAAKDGHDRNVRPAELLNSLGETVIMLLCGRLYPDGHEPGSHDPASDEPPPPPDEPASGPESAPEGPEGPDGAEPAAEPAQGHTGADAANGRPGLDALEDLAERRGRVTGVVTREVQALSLQQVDEELRLKNLPIDGGGGARRMRLITVEVEARIGLPMPDEIHEQAAPLMGEPDEPPIPQEEPPHE